MRNDNIQQNVLLHSTPMANKKRSTNSQNGPTLSNSGRAQASPSMAGNTMNQYLASHDDPFNDYTTGRQSKRRHPTQVKECEILEPSVFCNKAEHLIIRPMVSPMSPHLPRQRRNSHLSSSPGQLSAFGSLSQSPNTPITLGSTLATSFGSTMTREDSHGGSSMCGGLNMLKIKSQTSNNPTNFHAEPELSLLKSQPSLASFSGYSGASATVDGHNHFINQMGGISEAVKLQATIPPTPSAPSVLPSAADDEGVMKRSSSTETNGSSQSRVSRRSLELASSSRPIAPKVTDDMSMSRESSSSGHAQTRIRSADGTMRDVVSISKTPYVRPQQEKVRCTRCNEKPDGFRGDHELRRHTERAHGVSRKVFICVDISNDKTFLSKCKACRQEKRYRAYYNAAAHLRRTHFNPKQKGRKPRGQPQEPQEKRGGKGGGDHPSMEILKMWMREEEEFVPGNMPIPADDLPPELDEITMTEFLNSAYENATSTIDNTTINGPDADAPHLPSQSLDIPGARHRGLPSRLEIPTSGSHRSITTGTTSPLSSANYSQLLEPSSFHLTQAPPSSAKDGLVIDLSCATTMSSETSSFHNLIDFDMDDALFSMSPLDNVPQDSDFSMPFLFP